MAEPEHHPICGDHMLDDIEGFPPECLQPTRVIIMDVSDPEGDIGDENMSQSIGFIRAIRSIGDAPMTQDEIARGDGMLREIADRGSTAIVDQITPRIHCYIYTLVVAARDPLIAERVLERWPAILRTLNRATRDLAEIISDMFIIPVAQVRNLRCYVHSKFHNGNPGQYHFWS